MITSENLKREIENISNNYNEEPIGGYITGDGPMPCKILFVGEAPGKTEVKEGKPFVGKAGTVFGNYINSIGLSRNNIRITNTCFFRPIKIKKNKNGKTTISNRPPKINEINIFKEILNKEIQLVNPKIIITLGNIPLKQFTEFKKIGDCHGQIYFNSLLNKNIFPMYHPSALIYNRTDSFLKTYEEDWQKLKTILKTIIL